jgi:hypothetical protein
METHRKSVCAVQQESCVQFAVWQFGLWSFQAGGTKLERHFTKNQPTQRKLLNLIIELMGSLNSLQKSEFLKMFIFIFHVAWPQLWSSMVNLGQKCLLWVASL